MKESPVRQEQVTKPVFTTESHKGEFYLYKRVADDISPVFNEVFSQFYSSSELPFKRERLEIHIGNPKASLVLLRDKGKCVGFTYCHPAKEERNQEEDVKYKIWLNRALWDITENYPDFLKKTFEVGYTAILSEERHKGGWGKMMDVWKRKCILPELSI